MANTPNIPLPLMEASQSQKHVTHNESLQVLDVVVQLSVKDRDLATPPGSPVEGDRYIVASSPTGAWTGAAGCVAVYQSGLWAILLPKEGWLCWVDDEDIFLRHNGTTWEIDAPTQVNFLGINATANTTTRLSMNSAESLFNHDGAGHSLKINKAATGNTASVDLQNTFSGRAQLGLLGNDNLTVKVSADGSTFFDAVIFTAGSGIATFVDRVRAGSGTAASPGLAFSADTDVGLYRIGANQLGVSVGGALRMSVSTTALTIDATVTTLSATSTNISALYLGLGGATADATNRLSINTPGVLFNHAGTNVDMTFNKNASGNDNTLSFKTAFSTRGIIGTSGSDDLVAKVSPDGSSFFNGWVIDRATGRLVAAQWLNIAPRASDPGSPADGDIWYNSTNSQMEARIAGRNMIVGADLAPHIRTNAGRYIPTAMANSIATTTVAGVANQMNIYPWIPTRDISIDRLSINVTTLIAAALGKIVVYDSDVDGRPNNRLTETGDLDFSTTGVKEATVALSFLAGKQYWIGIRHSSTATVSAFQPYTMPCLDYTAVVTTAVKTLQRSLTYATAAPATWGYVATEANATNAAAIFMRIA